MEQEGDGGAAAIVAFASLTTTASAPVISIPANAGSVLSTRAPARFANRTRLAAIRTAGAPVSVPSLATTASSCVMFNVMVQALAVVVFVDRAATARSPPPSAAARPSS